MSVKFSVEDKDNGFDDMMSTLTDPEVDHVVVGVMAKAGAHEVEKAVGNEFGRKVTTGKKTYEIPARPWLRRSVDMHEKEIVKQGEVLALGVLDGKMSKKQALTGWGEYLQKTIRNGITSESLNLAPNAESTIEMKGSEKPLVDEEKFLAAINLEVRR